MSETVDNPPQVTEIFSTPLWKHPAVWTFSACWMIAVARLLAVGQREAILEWSGRFAGLLVFCWITVRITEPPPAGNDVKDSPWKLWLAVVRIAMIWKSCWFTIRRTRAGTTPSNVAGAFWKNIGMERC